MRCSDSDHVPVI